jgi:2-polyprenyl-3-methyl-5-hydroxy-6-metoxy-1,4-benzoquinol methylase
MNREKARAFVDEFMGFTSGATTIGLLAIADRCGLLTSMAGQPPTTAHDVATRAGLDTRYTTEILSGLSAVGVIDYDAAAETFHLSDEHAAVIADDTSPYSMAGWLDMLPSALVHIDAIAEATVHGGGVPFDAFGPTMVRGIHRAGSPSMNVLLTRRWLPQMPDVVERLTHGGSVADIGCGSGAAVVAMATTFPMATIVGLDVSAASIASAREAPKPHNATFVVGGSEALADRGPFDLVTAFDVVHDLADPLGVLTDIKRSLVEGGSLLVMEPRVDDRLENNMHPRAAVVYGISTLHCLTQSLAHGGVGLGAAAGPATIEGLCREAGFTTFTEVPIDNPFSAFYRAQ